MLRRIHFEEKLEKSEKLTKTRRDKMKIKRYFIFRRGT